MCNCWDDWDAYRWQFTGKAEPMADQTKCPECNQVVYVERGGRSVVTCLGCNTMWFVQYKGNTPLLYRFGTNQVTQSADTEKPAENPQES